MNRKDNQQAGGLRNSLHHHFTRSYSSTALTHNGAKHTRVKTEGEGRPISKEGKAGISSIKRVCEYAASLIE